MAEGFISVNSIPYLKLLVLKYRIRTDQARPQPVLILEPFTHLLVPKTEQ